MTLDNRIYLGPYSEANNISLFRLPFCRKAQAKLYLKFCYLYFIIINEHREG